MPSIAAIPGRGLVRSDRHHDLVEVGVIRTDMFVRLKWIIARRTEVDRQRRAAGLRRR
jgi:hypothetical protein